MRIKLIFDSKFTIELKNDQFCFKMTRKYILDKGIILNFEIGILSVL